jgi:hypothetical protein
MMASFQALRVIGELNGQLTIDNAFVIDVK